MQLPGSTAQYELTSIESAIRSRDCSEYLMPGVPIETPSLTIVNSLGSGPPQITYLTPIVLNCIPTNPAFSTPSLTLWLRSIKCMLHGFPEYHTWICSKRQFSAPLEIRTKLKRFQLELYSCHCHPVLSHTLGSELSAADCRHKYVQTMWQNECKVSMETLTHCLWCTLGSQLSNVCRGLIEVAIRPGWPSRCKRLPTEAISKQDAAVLASTCPLGMDGHGIPMYWELCKGRCRGRPEL